MMCSRLPIVGCFTLLSFVACSDGGAFVDEGGSDETSMLTSSAGSAGGTTAQTGAETSDSGHPSGDGPSEPTLATTIDSDDGSEGDDTTVVPAFALVDVNSTSATFEQVISPRDYLEKASGWYFTHAT